MPGPPSERFVRNMEDVLDLYEQKEDPKRPLVCFDETSKALHEHFRPPTGRGLTVPEIRRLWRRLLQPVVADLEQVLAWSHWRTLPPVGGPCTATIAGSRPPPCELPL